MEEKDFERLLRAIYLDPDYVDNPLDIDDLCRLHLGVSFEDFMRVGSALLPLTDPSESTVADIFYHAFMVDGIAYVKLESEL